jgi:acyl-CoA synthetase (AMP-forming)/AMP-acid ligase II
VTLGYLGQQELTARRCVPDPFTGGTMYRSGDLSRLRPDGCLEHLGRIDSQVKIRGFRIELDEIRAVLLEDPDAPYRPPSSYTATIRRTRPPPGSTRVAGSMYSGRTFADRRRVATPPTGGTARTDDTPTAGTGPPPTTTSPAPCGEIWAEVLAVPVDPDDNFFELGGNSLFAVRMSAALRARGLPSPRLREL